MAHEQDDLFKKIGIDIDQDKIEIDLGRTKAFFSSLQHKLQQKAEAVQQDLTEGKLDMEEKVGIKVDNEHINIDLAKTKSFIESLGRQIEGFVSELDNTVNDTVKRFDRE